MCLGGEPGSGSLAFPALPLALRPLPVGGFGVFPVAPRSTEVLHDPRDLRRHRRDRALTVFARMNMPLVELFESPLRRSTCLRPLPVRPEGHTFGRTAPSVSGPVPPTWFCTTSTVYSAGWPAGLLHPAHGHGVRHVSTDERWRNASRHPPPPPRSASTPRRIPLVDSRDPSPGPVPS